MLDAVMRHNLRYWFIFALIAFAAALIAPSEPSLQAQDGAAVISAETCAPVLQELWTTASTACINQPSGYVCNGGAAPAAEPSGLVSNALSSVGALVEVDTVDAIRTPPITTENASLGVAWLRLPDPLNVTVLMIGDVTMFDVTPPDFPAWTSSLIQSNSASATCAAAPKNVVVFQSGTYANVAVNGSSLALGGTVLVTTDDTSTVFIGLSGQSSVLALGQTQSLPAGEQIRVAHDAGNIANPTSAPTVAVPFDPAYVANLPVALFDRPFVLPQPGFATTQGAINLRVSPDLYSSVITQVPGGQALTILGRNEDGTWYNVQLRDGQTGWMAADLLASNVGDITAVYSATPLPPQRLGELGTKGRITAPAGANLRRGPEAVYAAVGIVGDGTLVNLLARSPLLNGWVKVEANGITGWISLLALETQAYIDALPVDYNIPALPTPRRSPVHLATPSPIPTAGDDYLTLSHADGERGDKRRFEKRHISSSRSWIGAGCLLRKSETYP